MSDARPRWQRSLVWLAAVALAVWFLAAAVPKLLDPAGFQQDVLAYRLGGHAFTALVAHIVPLVEVVAAVALLIPATRRAAAFMLGLLLLVFIIALAQAGLRGIDLACGCFQRGSGSGPWMGALANLITLLPVWLVICWTPAPVPRCGPAA